MKFFTTSLRLLLLLQSIFFVKSSRDYTGFKLVEITISKREDVATLRNIQNNSPEVSFWNLPATVGDKASAAVPPNSFESFRVQLEAAGLTFSITQEDIGATIESERTEVNQQSRLSPGGFDLFNYNRHTDINNYLDELVAKCTSKGLYCKTFSIGNSYEGRPLKVIKIGSSERPRPGFWIDAGIHAREWIAPATALIIANRLIYRYGVDTESTEAVDGFDWYILPSANPDGYEYTWEQDRLWRKTRSPNANSDCVGTDPNRNWDYHWMEIGASDEPCSDIYGGPHAFSEVETQAISSFLLNKTLDFAVYISLHAYGQYWLTPWGYTDDVPDDYQMLLELGQYAAEAIKELYGREFTVGSVTEVLYPSAGSSMDWTKAVAGIKYSLSPELRDKGKHGFILPPKSIKPVGRETWHGVRAIALRVMEFMDMD